MNTKLLNNRYQIIKVLGAGGFGETFLAEDTYMPSGRRCVIKKLKTIAGDPQTYNQVKQRFEREAATLELLGEGSDQIPKLYAYFSEKGLFYLVQEWIQGQTLTEIVETKGIFPESQVRKILLSLIPVLNYIHTRGIIHRDIKPDNIILSAFDGKPVLIDFGAVKETIRTITASPKHFSESLVIGTPGYMPSEQAIGRPVYASDIYSLGLTAIFLLTGKTPQDLQSDRETGEIFWQEYAPDVSPELAQILDRAVRIHAADRFTTVNKMLYALESEATIPPSTIAVKPDTANQKILAANPAVNPNVVRPNQQTRIVSSEPTTGAVAKSSSNSTPRNWQKIPAIFGSLILGGLIGGFGISNFNRQQIFPQKSVDAPGVLPEVRLVEGEPLPTPSPQTQSPSSRPTTSKTDNKNKAVTPRTGSVNNPSVPKQSSPVNPRSPSTNSQSSPTNSQSSPNKNQNPPLTSRSEGVDSRSSSVDRPSANSQSPSLNNESIDNGSIPVIPENAQPPGIINPQGRQKPPVILPGVREPLLPSPSRNQNPQTGRNNNPQFPHPPGIKLGERAKIKYGRKPRYERRPRLRRKPRHKIKTRYRGRRKPRSRNPHRVESKYLSEPGQVSTPIYILKPRDISEAKKVLESEGNRIKSRYITTPGYISKPGYKIKLRSKPRYRRRSRVRRKPRLSRKPRYGRKPRSLSEARYRRQQRKISRAQHRIRGRQRRQQRRISRAKRRVRSR
ncbi:serine/threonine-protein kinase [Mastigocoleus testarum]|uniref:non-specific serine/threonine protein kinase n=1 Tax=Mastigocoleus testarum BC008 TaxID=371196 RepID=A0A0V7ZHN3_9CYAN|nr:serine/threonine-protein kinase [Mastigocoleus testarum]KST63750.1 hypothetical protein BC008_14955 [Mastigocoleus testarum BC008]